MLSPAYQVYRGMVNTTVIGSHKALHTMHQDDKHSPSEEKPKWDHSYIYFINLLGHFYPTFTLQAETMSRRWGLISGTGMGPIAISGEGSRSWCKLCKWHNYRCLTELSADWFLGPSCWVHQAAVSGKTDPQLRFYHIVQKWSRQTRLCLLRAPTGSLKLHLSYVPPSPSIQEIPQHMASQSVSRPGGGDKWTSSSRPESLSPSLFVSKLRPQLGQLRGGNLWGCMFSPHGASKVAQ